MITEEQCKELCFAINAWIGEQVKACGPACTMPSRTEGPEKIAWFLANKLVNPGEHLYGLNATEHDRLIQLIADWRKAEVEYCGVKSRTAMAFTPELKAMIGCINEMSMVRANTDIEGMRTKEERVSKWLFGQGADT